MLLYTRRAASFLVFAVALVGFATAPAAQTTDDEAPTASTAPAQDAFDTAPRRRPVRRADAPSRVRSRPARRGVQPDSVAAPVRTVSSRAESATLRAARVDRSLRDAAPGWLGIPYRWGGTTRRGIDCSAFVQQFVREHLAVELTRTTATQRYEGEDVDRDQLRAGDLVFFRTGRTRHVGVYLSGGDFIHASSSQGVTISTLDSGYWNDRYWMSRRILEDAPPPPRLDPRIPRSPARG